MKRDNIHFTFREIDGYNKPFNFVISEREPGKSTALVIDKFYQGFKKYGAPSIALQRNAVDITEQLIRSYESIINKFIENEEDKITITYKASQIGTGICDLFIKEKLFIRLLAMSLPIQRIKRLIIPNVYCIGFDEFICNPQFKEKYLAKEWSKFEEIYTTYNREAFKKPLKCYFCGNPYSKFNPYFRGLKVDLAKLTIGAIITGISWAIQVYKTSDELKSYILKNNPLYEFDEAYKKYAFEGQSINDANIYIMRKRPENFHLRFVFKIDNDFIGIWQNNNYNDIYYHASKISEFSARRCVYCFDFEDLADQSALLDKEDKSLFNRFKIAMRKRLVAFESEEVYYLCVEIYQNI